MGQSSIRRQSEQRLELGEPFPDCGSRLPKAGNPREACRIGRPRAPNRFHQTGFLRRKFTKSKSQALVRSFRGEIGSSSHRSGGKVNVQNRNLPGCGECRNGALRGFCRAVSLNLPVGRGGFQTLGRRSETHLETHHFIPDPPAQFTRTSYCGYGCETVTATQTGCTVALPTRGLEPFARALLRLSHTPKIQAFQGL